MPVLRELVAACKTTAMPDPKLTAERRREMARRFGALLDQLVDRVKVAEATGISRETLKNWAEWKDLKDDDPPPTYGPSAWQLVVLAEHLNISLDALLGTSSARNMPVGIAIVDPEVIGRVKVAEYWDEVKELVDVQIGILVTEKHAPMESGKFLRLRDEMRDHLMRLRKRE